MKRIKQLSLIAAAITAAFMATACGDRRQTEKPVITVSIEPLRYFTERIAGDRFHVVTMVPGGSSPETYEPTARQMTELNSSELYIKVGSLGFEHTWMKRFKSNTPHLIVIDSSEGIRTLPTTDEGNDQHVWTSPINALQIAHNIYKALVKIHAKDSLYFRANLDSLHTEITDIGLDISRRLDSARQRSFIIYHPALTYFAAEYGLRQIAIEENGREPSAASLRTQIDRAVKNGTRLMFVQKGFANRNTETVRRSTGVRVVEINPLSYEWKKELMRITDELCRQ